jgi:hypothetical protein
VNIDLGDFDLPTLTCEFVSQRMLTAVRAMCLGYDVGRDRQYNDRMDCLNNTTSYYRLLLRGSTIHNSAVLSVPFTNSSFPTNLDPLPYWTYCNYLLLRLDVLKSELDRIFRANGILSVYKLAAFGDDVVRSLVALRALRSAEKLQQNLTRVA